MAKRKKKTQKKTKPKPLKTARESRLLPHILQGLLLLGWALFLLLSLVSYRSGDPHSNWLGLSGHVIAWGFLYLFGLATSLIPIYAGWGGWRLLRNRPVEQWKSKTFYFITLLFSSAVLLAMASDAAPGFAAFFDRWAYADYFPRSSSYDPAKLRHYLGGVPFHHLYVDTAVNFRRYLGTLGTFLLFSTLFVLSGTLLTDFPMAHLFGRLMERLKKARPKLNFAAALPKWKPEKRVAPYQAVEEDVSSAPPLSREDPLKKETQIHLPKRKKREESSSSPLPAPPKRCSLDEYQLPPPTLLTEVDTRDPASLKDDLRKQAEVLEETLLSFGIEAKVGEIHCGPTITSFEVHPAVGVKVQKIKALENDIALNMQARSIRIIAPIPGKAAVGIEVPNAHPQEVSFRELLEAYQGSSKKMQIPMLLGKVVNGDDVWNDLTKMPHMIIAGATGSGKSVCINTIVMSLVMNKRPDEVKLVMVDPKKVELTAYTHLPHMLAPVITEPGGALAALNWLVKEMERRYELCRLLGIRNIHGFNSRKIDPQLEASLDLEVPDKIPYIVVIIDELADLMMVASSDIETPIARIAQMARAVGIHLILATQRPSREVITGLIKANFPSRIAFKVSSRVNSQIIIDENGAETLLGNGDMLFLPPGSSNLLRAQGAFIRDEDINKVIHYVCSQAPTNYLIPSFDNFRGEEGSDLFDLQEKTPTDPLYDDAKRLVFETGNASTTFLQRKMKVGYARAASLMDQLEESGVIGPSEGAKPRKIFYPQGSEE